jgi:ribonuclease HI
MSDKITVYTDGSALSNGRPGSGCGWACKLMYKGQARMKSGGAIGETNNRMEMQAVLEAMKSITDKTIPVEVYSDSNYVVETMNGRFAMKKNRDLWRTGLGKDS